jgi:selenocysteine-specific elongation factor
MRADHPLTLGTAGHIDHGKTALVAALTGVDTDRLPQEKSRGISIELGYAPLELPSGRRLSVVDVPGHERFVRTMVAGATGVDLFLLVIALDDGVMPQTREHLAIIRLLGLKHGVIALTKRDLVDAETAEIVRLEVADLAGDLPAVEVSSRDGTGLDDLRAALDAAAAGVGARAADGPVRLPVDRSFTLRGIGTVVTGTLWSGTVQPQMRLAVEPGGADVRVRSVQVHDQPVDAAGAGQRVAIALVGAERSDAPRGSTLATPGALRVTFRLECEIQVLPTAPHALRHGERVTVHHGTTETPATVAVRGGAELSPGASGMVQLRLASAVAALNGDRVIVRLTAPRTTIAGGHVTDPRPTRSGAPRQPAPEPAAQAVRAAPSAAGAAALLARLEAEGLTPAPLDPAEREPAAHLAAEGRIVRAGADLALAAGPFTEAARAAVALAGEPDGLTLARLRDRLGVSRKYAQAILEALDEQGYTRRTGDVRQLRRRGRELASAEPAS